MKKKLIVGLLGMALIMSIGSTYGNAAVEEGIKLEVEKNNNVDTIAFKWNKPNDDCAYEYSLFVKGGNEKREQMIQIKDTAHVLNVYPGKGNNLKTWMEDLATEPIYDPAHFNEADYVEKIEGINCYYKYKKEVWEDNNKHKNEYYVTNGFGLVKDVEEKRC